MMTKNLKMRVVPTRGVKLGPEIVFTKSVCVVQLIVPVSLSSVFNGDRAFL